MKICRFADNRLGVLQGTRVLDVTGALDVLPAMRYPVPAGDALITHLPALRHEIERLLPTAAAHDAAALHLLSPVANPGKVIAAPVNYARHLAEARDQVEIHHHNRIATIHEAGLFLKATSSVVGMSDGVELAHPDRRHDHEAELVVVIGAKGRDIPAARALEHVAGYTAGLDMTVRGPEERSLRKSLDSYSVLGPWLVTADEIADSSNLGFELHVNGRLRQKANTRDLVCGIPDLIAFASRFYTLYPGDLLFTGTPEGVGPVVPGDRIDGSFDGIGQFTVQVRAASRAVQA